MRLMLNYFNLQKTHSKYRPIDAVADNSAHSAIIGNYGDSGATELSISIIVTHRPRAARLDIALGASGNAMKWGCFGWSISPCCLRRWTQRNPPPESDAANATGGLSVLLASI
jgi:hypothetical protein